MRAYFYISENDYWRLADKLKEDNVPVVLLTDLQESDGYQGHIETVGGSFEKNEGRIMVRASIANHDHVLRSGTTGRIRLETFMGDALIIPKEATVRNLNKTMVYKVGPGDILQYTVVSVRELDDLNYIVESGLDAGDRVVLNGFDKVHDGMEITES